MFEAAFSLFLKSSESPLVASMAVWASIGALVASLYAAIRIRRVREVVDRNLSLMGYLPRVHDLINQVEIFLEQQKDKLAVPAERTLFDSAIKNVQNVKRDVENLCKVEHWDDFTINGGQLRAAEWFRVRGLVVEAIRCYEEAREFDVNNRNLSADARDVCYKGLQECYLMRGRIPQAIRTVRRAVEQEVVGLISEKELEGVRGWINMGAYHLRLRGRRAIALVRRDDRIRRM